MSNEPVVKEKVDLDPRYIFRLTGILLAICAVVSLLLAVVNSATEPIITAMQAEKTAKAMAQVLQAEEYDPVSVSVPGVTAVSEAKTGGKRVGHVVEVTTNGFGGAINMVVGVDADGAVTGVSVIKHTETGNIGTKVVGDSAVLGRFAGMSLDKGEITVNSGANRFDGVTGATVSSKGVTAGVNAALAAVAQLG